MRNIVIDSSKFNYSPTKIKRTLRVNDFYRFQLRQNKIDQLTTQISEHFSEKFGEVRPFAIGSFKNKKIFMPKKIYDLLTLRRTSDIIKSVCHISTFSREDEVVQLQAVIRGEMKCCIIKTDISNFFESVDFTSAIDKLVEKGFNNHSSLAHLNNLSKVLKALNFNGLPRGLALSSILAEVYLEEFDRNLRLNREVLYYSRYVDDIVIVTNSDPQLILGFIQRALPGRLLLNKKKTRYYIKGRKEKFDFLGYSISLENDHAIGIAHKKISKTKKRIILSIKDYIRNNDPYLLIDRIRFLTGNTEMKMHNRYKKITVGFKFQYRICDSKLLKSELQNLDNFFYSVLTSKNYKISAALKKRIGPKAFLKLKTLSFTGAYNNNIIHFRTSSKISLIRKAWKYA
ncbi:RNA-directed DNA polymerase [Leptospira sp. 201903070]|uniref:RNA-directed DNA polymerase n=1 Tax=Leptospira ainlahdjerensis TaxID=2810033 RepID=A0ABS2U8G2_9LEPT|nr:antiviral reverse transcriptase Drt3a [Leptospira ainlahdjerensis]MBM9576223.1 RNA-directed DNA polymerase [Leptospira ainlahdjerensis]